VDELIVGLERVVDEAGDPEQQLRAAVAFHIRFHTQRQAEPFLSHSELRSLTAANFRRIGSPARESDLPSHAGRDSSPRPDAIPEADI
jgi:hypothetical protein